MSSFRNKPLSPFGPGGFYCGEIGEWGLGIRGGGGLTAAEYIWGMCAGECEKPVQVETFKAPQAWGAVCEAD